MENVQALTVLLGKGVEELHHCNTVLTSCAFLRQGALLSRGFVESHGISQTPQYTDAMDKRFGVWGDIFLDGVDIHYRRRDRNQYGPVLFCFSTKSILQDRKTQGALRICRDNPANWRNGAGEAERYFATPQQLQAEYCYGDFGKSLTFRTVDGTLPLEPHLSRIEIDAPPCMLGGKSAFDVASAAVKKAAVEGGVTARVQRHDCQSGCRCGTSYAGMREAQIKALFSL